MESISKSKSKLLSNTRSPSPREDKPKAALQFARQAEKLAVRHGSDDDLHATAAVEGKFVTPHDAVIETAEGGRLPSVPLKEAERLNELRERVDTGRQRDSGSAASSSSSSSPSPPREARVLSTRTSSSTLLAEKRNAANSRPGESQGRLDTCTPPSHTHPLFPPLPIYGPPSFLRNLQCQSFRVISFFLSLSFLGAIVLGSLLSSIPTGIRHTWMRLRGRNPDEERKFYPEEIQRERARKEAAERWERRLRQKKSEDDMETGEEDYPPLEGGKDPLISDLAYYARRVGLDAEKFKVQTEDGFLINLWHLYDPKEYTPLPEEERQHRGPDVFQEQNKKGKHTPRNSSNRRYPVLLIPGLLQQAGTYCANDDDSLSFFLCKAGYDVWLGDNRCGFEPVHTMLTYADPRMWAWNIRQMGVLDLPALISRVLYQTGFDKLGLICHSQGTTETLVALARDQRPEIGQHISVFCALAPAAYAGPLIKKMYFRFMRIISPSMFRLFFGIHAFIPFMMTIHSVLHPRIYGALGYRVFSYLFGWTDDRWDRGLRDRMFQFSPVYVSVESMRWWLGRDCFAKQKCILATREDAIREDLEDDRYANGLCDGDRRADGAWYGPGVPPFALWIAGSDDLVDGRRLLRRFRNGREPHVDVVHAKIIDEYEHLDVVWALDMIEQVGKEVRDVLWKTVPEDVKASCRIPRGVQPML
ncbi:hypothetical protein DTO027B5_497 [Paecilomyces variotii]|nr:hypothetical protein DTO169C6_3788 [Paecilomyces variotii]KAJ9326738.1 hypothetical protein DTO027B3_2399 [Paecilomyces variotii]KAJ9337676.1 hypothetical protein DTO027B5_497 [Paecilomyces variotii]KAJ9395475.1 hypothetical protein DTO282F9_7628 [Paecilomyces variotii]